MPDPIFVRTRHLYDSYSDLFRLVELSGFPTCYVDEIDASDPARCYILPTRNGESQAGWPGAQARIIHFNLEWDAYPPLDGVAESWAADKWFAESIGARYVPIGSHPGLRLTDNQPATPLYDVAYLGYMIPRREQISTDLRLQGVKASPIHAWGDERDAVLNASRAYLHVHQHADKPGVPPLRMVVAAAYSLPVITETCADAGIFTSIYSLKYGEIAENVAYWMNNANGKVFADTGARFHEQLCHDLTFRKSIEAAL